MSGYKIPEDMKVRLKDWIEKGGYVIYSTTLVSNEPFSKRYKEFLERNNLPLETSGELQEAIFLYLRITAQENKNAKDRSDKNSDSKYENRDVS